MSEGPEFAVGKAVSPIKKFASQRSQSPLLSLNWIAGKSRTFSLRGNREAIEKDLKAIQAVFMISMKFHSRRHIGAQANPFLMRFSFFTSTTHNEIHFRALTNDKQRQFETLAEQFSAL